MPWDIDDKVSTHPFNLNIFYMLTEKIVSNLKKKIQEALNLLEHNAKRAEIEEAVKAVLATHSRSPFYFIYNETAMQIGIDSQRYILLSTAEKPATIAAKTYTIVCLQQPNNVSGEMIPYLQILDLIGLVLKKPDKELGDIIKNCGSVIGKLSEEEQKILIRCARKYTPGVRAVLGLVMAELNKAALSQKALQTLNPVMLNRYKEKLRLSAL